MNELHDYICKHLLELLKRRCVIVFYDPRHEFTPFIDELPVLDNQSGTVTPVHVHDTQVHLARFSGSFFGLRAAVEPLVHSDQPELLLIYLPGVVRDHRGSLLMELEKGGGTYEPQLKRLARNVLRQKYTEGTIDQMLAPESITYADIVAFLRQTEDEESYSMLKLIFPGLSDGVSLLVKWLTDASLILVRSQEIDALGESGDDWLARQLMDTIVGNLARAVHKLAGCGIERFVIVSDHGYQFSMRKEEDMRMDSPGGDTVEIHRRCWAGRGGATPPGAVRISGAELGYDTDLDFIFPTGLAVFKTQGGLSYHHGGISLQEMVIPVISLRMAIAAPEKTAAAQVKIFGYPKTITNRTFGIQLACDPHMFQKDSVTLRVVLVSKGEQVGETGMTVGGAFDRKTGCVTIKPGEKVSVGIMLTKDDCEMVRVVVQVPATDAVLAQSEELPVKLGI